jgi:hypothetical protein
MPDYMIPFVPIIQEDEEPFAMFQNLKQKYGEWVLDVLEYDSADGLIEVLEPNKRTTIAALNQLADLAAESNELTTVRNMFCGL